jgi:uncharacterized peroxidase-related enzyme
MSWIDEIDVDVAEGKLGAVYAELVKKRGKVSNILKVHSLNPEALESHLGLYMTAMFGKSGLSRAEREAVAVVVSATNDCAYCVNHHAEALRRYIKDDETLEMLMAADGLETLEPRLSNIVRHAEKLTSAPSVCLIVTFSTFRWLSPTSISSTASLLVWALHILTKR